MTDPTPPEVPDVAPVTTLPATHKTPAHLAATQTVYPWRASLRAGAAALVGFELAAAAASPVIGPFVDHYIPGAGATVVGFGLFCGGLATLTNRVINLPAVARFLTSIHLGPTPKS